MINKNAIILRVFNKKTFAFFVSMIGTTEVSTGVSNWLKTLGVDISGWTEKMLSGLFGGPWWAWAIACYLAALVVWWFDKNSLVALKEAFFYLDKKHKILDKHGTKNFRHAFKMTSEEYVFYFYLPHVQDVIVGDKLSHMNTLLKKQLISKEELPIFSAEIENGRATCHSDNKFSQDYTQLLSNDDEILYQNLSVKKSNLDKILVKLNDRYKNPCVA